MYRERGAERRRGILEEKSRSTNLESNMNDRFNALENRFLSLEARFGTLTGKVIEVGNRLTRVEAILDRH